MNKEELISRFLARIEEFRLEDFDLTVKLRSLSALERAKFTDIASKFDKREEAEKYAAGEPGILERITRELQCYVVSHGLVDDDGKRMFGDSDYDLIVNSFPCTALDIIHGQILKISKLTRDAGADEIKNSDPAPSELSSSGLQPDSAGGM